MALMQQETVEHAKLRALAQILVDKEKGVEAFEEYMKVAFPYLEVVKKRDKETMLKVLKAWVGEGPLNIKAMAPSPVQSRLVKTLKNKGSRGYN